MKHPFPEIVEGKIKIISMDKYPEEICGFVMNDEFVEMENVADDTVKDFRIDEKEYLKYRKKIQAVIHSHCDYPHLSKTDMKQQIASALPWGVAFVQKGYYEGMMYFGDQIEPYPLKERPFVHGAWDCYGLIRDYHKIHKGVTIPIFPRENNWWKKDSSMLKNGCEEAGFQYIDQSQAREGDVFFMMLRAKVVNHCGIYLGGEKILHHLYGTLSREDFIGRWWKYVTDWLRYKG